MLIALLRLFPGLLLATGAIGEDGACWSALAVPGSSPEERGAEEAVLLQLKEQPATDEHPVGKADPAADAHSMGKAQWISKISKSTDPRMLWAVKAEQKADVTLAESMKLWVQADGMMKEVARDMVQKAGFATQQAVKLGRSVGLQRVVEAISSGSLDGEVETPKEGELPHAALIAFGADVKKAQESGSGDDNAIGSWKAAAELERADINSHIRRGWILTYQALAKVQDDSKAIAAQAWNANKAFSRLMRWMIFASSPEARQSVAQDSQGTAKASAASLLQVAEHPSTDEDIGLAQQEQHRHLHGFPSSDPMVYWTKAVKTREEANDNASELFGIASKALTEMRKQAEDEADWAQGMWAKVFSTVSNSTAAAPALTEALPIAKYGHELTNWGSFSELSAKLRRHAGNSSQDAALKQQMLEPQPTTEQDPLKGLFQGSGVGKATIAETKAYVNAAQERAEAEATRNLFLALASSAFANITATAEAQAARTGMMLERITTAKASHHGL